MLPCLVLTYAFFDELLIDHWQLFCWLIVLTTLQRWMYYYGGVASPSLFLFISSSLLMVHGAVARLSSMSMTVDGQILCHVDF